MKHIWLYTALFSSLGLGLQTLFWQSPWMGVPFFALFVISFSKLFSDRFFPSFSFLPKLILSFFLLLCELMVVGTITYYLSGITPLTSVFITFIPFFTLFLPAQTSPRTDTSTTNLSLRHVLFSLPVIAIDVFLLYYLKSHQIFDVSTSPWQATSAIFFLLFFVSTFFLLLNAHKQINKTFFLSLTSLHFFVTVSVVAILYPLGYGFDAFIHRATEQWIVDNGFILPKTPYYIGQYSLVAYLAHILSLPVRLLDIFLLPVLSSLLLPAVVISSIEKITKSSFALSSQLFWVLGMIPFFYFHLTTPHTLVVLFTLILVFFMCLPAPQRPNWILWLISATAVATHALIGVPLLCIVFFFTLHEYKWFSSSKKKYTLLLFVLLSALTLVLPLLFTANALRIHAPLPELHNPFAKIKDFVELFQRPYWYETKIIPFLEPLYIFERLLIPGLIFLAALGLFVSKKQKNFSLHIFLWTVFVGFILSSFALRTTITFPDVIAYEQKDYPIRLLKVSILFLIPSVVVALHFLIDTLQKIKLVQKFSFAWSKIAIGTAAFLLTAVLYLSYPQNNAKVHFPGFHVTLADHKAVEFIHARHSDYNYIVLANQLVSVAALEKYSFAKYFQTPAGELFYYAIPTGGKLYDFYYSMIYKGQKREYMDAAMDLVGVKTAYFVVDSYWKNADKIVTAAKQSADEWYEIEGGKVWILVYTKK